jgi:diguanylate cyclase (GGDEF)-like protein/PAS domain S-box-containing protein
MNGNRGWAGLCLCLVGVLLAWGGGGLASARAADYADVAINGPSIELLSFFSKLDTGDRDAKVMKPGNPPEGGSPMGLHASGPGPNFRWIVAGFTNSADKETQSVIVFTHQGFVGSGLVWPKPPGSQIVSVNATEPAAVLSLKEPGRDAFALTLGPGQTVFVAFELAGAIPTAASLWQQGAYVDQKDTFAFLRGALLGIAALLCAAMFALYGFRARAVFLAGGGFALASLAFMVLEAGHLSRLLAILQVPGLSLLTARPLIEGSMAAFLILYTVTVSEVRRDHPVVGNLLLLAGGLAFAIPVYGFADPLVAAGVARMVFAAAAALGFLLIYVYWRRGEQRAETALVSISAILLWTLLAFAAAVADPRSQSILPVLLAGLCAVLVVMGFTLANLAFNQGYLTRHFFREAGRRALALAGARAYVWDWQPEGADLHVGEEIETALGLTPGVVADGGIDGFLELMHPADRTSYLAAVDAAEQQGNGAIEREFRLQHGDGSYRWFQLRGRAMPGQGRRAARCIGTLTDVTGAKLTEERLLNDAVHDLVTGLPNRALFVDRLTRALALAEAAEGSQVHVLLIDVDRFKPVNDALGHAAGDTLLTVIGRRLLAEITPADSVARMPGDQFAVLFVAATPEREIAAFSENIRRAIARPIKLDAHELFLTASIGIAHNREKGLSAEQLLKDAALALYEAKRRGTDVIEVFQTSMRDDRAELVVLENDLRRAIERNEIEVHYQPIARLADMNLAGFEALVRWRHPSLGLLAPESFIGLAEQTDLIKSIGRTVINEAGRQLGIWQRAYRPTEPLFVAVNISSAQLIEPALIDEVKQVLHREGVHRGSFKIEVTESLVMQYPERASQILERFRELGVGLACDDFGTGYSSLASLRRLPFDTLKVDRSFIAADAEDTRSGVILEAIVAMGHSLGVTIVAEGIENQDQVDRLGELGCDLGQGFFIGRPMTGRQVSDALTGLPYAQTNGRTAITWLWEKSNQEPAPEPAIIAVPASPPVEEAEAVATETAVAPEPAERKHIPALATRAVRARRLQRTDEEEPLIPERRAALARKMRLRKRKIRAQMER